MEVLTETVHCPHCHVALAGADRLPYPPEHMRCPSCRLSIGAGRGQTLATGGGGAPSHGSAAGMIVNAARRAQSAPGDPETICAALHDAAAALGCSVERVRMIDYQQAAEHDRSLPGVACVLATFRTWKGARRAAAATQPAPGLQHAT